MEKEACQERDGEREERLPMRETEQRGQKESEQTLPSSADVDGRALPNATAPTRRSPTFTCNLHCARKGRGGVFFVFFVVLKPKVTLQQPAMAQAGEAVVPVPIEGAAAVVINVAEVENAVGVSRTHGKGDRSPPAHLSLVSQYHLP